MLTRHDCCKQGMKRCHHSVQQSTFHATCQHMKQTQLGPFTKHCLLLGKEQDTPMLGVVQGTSTPGCILSDIRSIATAAKHHAGGRCLLKKPTSSFKAGPKSPLVGTYDRCSQPGSFCTGTVRLLPLPPCPLLLLLLLTAAHSAGPATQRVSSSTTAA